MIFFLFEMRLALSPKLLHGLSKIRTPLTRQSLSGAHGLHQGSREMSTVRFLSQSEFLRGPGHMAAQSKCVPFKSFLNAVLPVAVVSSHSGERATLRLLTLSRGSCPGQPLGLGAVMGSGPPPLGALWPAAAPVPPVTWTELCPARHAGTLGVRGFARRLEATSRC